MQIILSAIETGLAKAWQQFCGDLPQVTIHRGSILDLKVDAVISPANSFGFMDGGIDHLFSRHFGWEVQDRLQQLIRTRHHGELLVGMAEIVTTGNEQIPYLISAPTMRVPMRLSNSVNPYLAARGAMLLIRNGHFAEGPLIGERIGDVVQSVAFPGLGTGVGGIGFNTCALQVRKAIEDVVLQSHHFPSTWAEAQIRHQQLYTDNIRDLQYGEN